MYAWKETTSADAGIQVPHICTISSKRVIDFEHQLINPERKSKCAKFWYLSFKTYLVLDNKKINTSFAKIWAGIGTQSHQHFRLQHYRFEHTFFTDAVYLNTYHFGSQYDFVEILLLLSLQQQFHQPTIWPYRAIQAHHSLIYSRS